MAPPPVGLARDLRVLGTNLGGAGGVAIGSLLLGTGLGSKLLRVGSKLLCLLGVALGHRLMVIGSGVQLLPAYLTQAAALLSAASQQDEEKEADDDYDRDDHDDGHYLSFPFPMWRLTSRSTSGQSKTARTAEITDSTSSMWVK